MYIKNGLMVKLYVHQNSFDSSVSLLMIFFITIMLIYFYTSTLLTA